MTPLWFVARTEISHQMRERETLVWVFVMPIVFMFFIGTVTGGAAGGGMGADATPARRDPLAIEAPADSGWVLDDLVRRLEMQNFHVIRRGPADTSNAEPPARRLIVHPPASGRTFSDAVLARERQTLRLESRTAGASADLERIRVQRAIYTLLADLALASDARGPDPAGGASEPPGAAGPAPTPPDAADLARIAAAPRTIALEVRTAGRRARAPSGFEQTVPGTMVMFTMLVLLTGGAIRLVIEREQGLLRRLASAPISRAHVVAGKWIGKLVLGLVQIGFALAAGTVLFQMEWGGALPMVLVVLAAWAAFNASLGLLLGSVARSAAQMSGIGVLTSLVLAALGGCWWPIEVAPDWARRLALALPTGWTMDAMHRLISFGDPAGAAVPHVLALLAGAVLLGAAAGRVFRYQ